MITCQIWGSRGATKVSYRNFVHLRDKEGRNVLNADRYPTSHGIEMMTDRWIYGDIIVDVQNVQVPATTKSGNLVLALGWFDLKTGHRLGRKHGGDELVTDLEIEVYVLS